MSVCLSINQSINQSIYVLCLENLSSLRLHFSLRLQLPEENDTVHGSRRPHLSSPSPSKQSSHPLAPPSEPNCMHAWSFPPLLHGPCAQAVSQVSHRPAPPHHSHMRRSNRVGSSQAGSSRGRRGRTGQGTAHHEYRASNFTSLVKQLSTHLRAYLPACKP